MLKKWIAWGAIAFVVFFVAFKPSAAGGVITVLGQTCVAIFHGIGNFFSSLAQGQ